MNSTKSMTAGRPGPLIFFFALPLMIGNLFQQFYIVTDTMIVGQVLGVNALAALGAVDWQIWMVLGTIQGLTQGFSIWMSQEFGAQQHSRLRNVIANSIILSAISALVIIIVGQILVMPSLYALNTPKAVLSNAEKYMRTIIWGVPVTMAYNLLASILRSLGDSKTPLFAMIFASFVNIFLDLLFVAFWGMGVVGAAAATIIAQFCAAVFCLIKIGRIDILKLKKADWDIRYSSCSRLLGLGFPMAFQNMVISIGGMIVQHVINGFGVIFLAAFTATNKLYSLLDIAAVSYGYAITTYTGQNLGAGKIQRIRQGYRTGLLIALVTSCIIMTLIILGGRSILSLFISGDPQTIAETLDIAYHYLFIMSMGLPVLYYLHVTRSCVQGMGNTILPMMSGVSEFVMRTGTALLLPIFMGREGIFYAEVLAWAGADVVLFFSYRYCNRKLDHAPAD